MRLLFYLTTTICLSLVYHLWCNVTHSTNCPHGQQMRRKMTNDGCQIQ